MKSFLQFNQSPLFLDDIFFQDVDHSEPSEIIQFQRPTTDKKTSILIEEPFQAESLSKKLDRKVKKQKVGGKQKKRRRKNKKGRNYKSPDYRKNICGYITKKTLRQFIGPNYQKIVLQMCNNSNSDYEIMKNFYSTKIQRVTGPSHLPQLINSKDPLYYEMNQIFLRFFRWFLQERYVRHLYLQGKMELKKEYIEYKNRQLLPMLAEFEKKIQLETQLSNNFIQNAISMSTQ